MACTPETLRHSSVMHSVNEWFLAVRNKFELFKILNRKGSLPMPVCGKVVRIMRIELV